MADKRFLGLGFTFSADDNGLEDKLSSINTLLSDISDSLDSVNNGFSSMGNAQMPSATSPAKSGGGGAIGPSRARPSTGGGGFSDCCMQLVQLGMGQLLITEDIRRSLKDHFEKSEKWMDAVKMGGIGGSQFGDGMKSGRLLDMMNSLSDFSRKTIEQLTKVWVESGGSVDDLKKKLNMMNVTIDHTGDFVDSTISDFRHLAQELLSEGKYMGEFLKQFKGFQVALGAVGEYLSDVKESSESFLATLGVDMSKIIPAQAKALVGLIGSVLSGPFKLMKMAFSPKKKTKESVFLDKINKIGMKQSNQLGGPGTKTKNIYKLLEKVAENTSPKKKTLWEKLMDMLADAAVLLIGPLIALGAAVLTVIEGFKELSIVKFLTKVFEGIWEAGKALIKGFEFLTDGALGKLFKYLSESKLGKTIGQFFKWIEEATIALRESKFVGTLIKWGIKIGEWFGKFGEWISGIVKFLERSKFLSFFLKLGEGLGLFALKVFDVIGWIVIAYDSITGIVQAFKEAHGVMDFILKALWNIANNIFMGVPSWLADKLGFGGNKNSPQPTTTPTLQPSGFEKKDLKDWKMLGDKSDELQDTLVKSGKMNADQTDQIIDLHKQLNAKMDDLIQATTQKTSPQVNVQQNFDSKKFGLTWEQKANDRAATGG